jgi:hypothetical protein
MNLEQAKLVFQNSGLLSASAVKAPMQENTWHLQLNQRSGANCVLQAARGGERNFKTIDAAVGAAEQIGFKNVLVCM